jgi:tripartite-type tricarboxylate transporter receptor subunit TctC
MEVVKENKAMRRLIPFLLVACVVVAAPGAVHAQNFPSKYIRIVLPFQAGGLLDVVAQVVADKFQQKWGQPAVLDHRTGAAGNIAAEAVYRSEPDGHMLLLSPPGPIALNKLLYAKLGYDSDEFVPISILVETPAVLVAHPDVPANTPQQLITYAKANPGKLNYATPGAGSTPHLAAVLFQSMAGIQIVPITYKGTAPANLDLVAGRVQLAFAQFSTVLPLIRSGQLRLIAVASESRSKLYPDVPALTEILPGFYSANFFGLVAPPGLSPELASRLSATAAEALQQPDVAKKLQDLTTNPVGNSPDQAREFLAREKKRWGQVIRTANIKIE